jgi:Zn-dependent peptidase ImmA (M78 family)
VRLAYENAGFDANNLGDGIAPLYSLIEAYPIRTAQLANLTYESAIDFLSRETGQTMPVPKTGGKLAGFLYVYQYRGRFYGCILVEADEPVVRRRFSAAHELGHYVVHFLPLLRSRATEPLSQALVLTEGLTYEAGNEVDGEMPSGQLTFARGSSSSAYNLTSDIRQMEREANQFAAELLMPAPACRALVEQYSPSFSSRPRVLARRLASELLVSQEAMKWRLASLNLPASLADGK